MRIKYAEVGERSNPPDLRLLSVKGDTKSETQTSLDREISGPEETIVGSNPTFSTNYAHVRKRLIGSTGNIPRIEFPENRISRELKSSV